MHTIATLILALGLANAAPVQTVDATVFAYTSTIGQTDDSPFTTASGGTVHDGTVANNCLPFGTIVTFPEQFGDKQFVVEDRMASRYSCATFDIWFTNTSVARSFGKQYTTVQVY
ncbi:MAG: 3D domain-containing protein [Candidatus Kerfeldbacteria bacterium]|nr:3D domain-containing protein [Candidatus Kerfeldbacteria bacterium]